MSRNTYLLRVLATVAVSGILGLPCEIFRWIFTRPAPEGLAISTESGRG